MSVNLSHSMRSNYNTHGVEGYYNIVSESCQLIIVVDDKKRVSADESDASDRNPHFAGLKKVLSEFLDRYMEYERPERITVIDLAAGSGEATEAVLSWKASRWPSLQATGSLVPCSVESASTAASTSTCSPSILANPSLIASSSRPPFTPPNRRPAVPRPAKTSKISSLPPPIITITASDPYTAAAYRTRTGGLPCLELSFNDVAAGQLPPITTTSTLLPDNEAAASDDDAVDKYDLVIISFALHLVESTSELWALLDELKKRVNWLVVIAPHKKPDVKDSWGWQRFDPNRWKIAEGKPNEVGGKEGDGWEIVLDRVRLRVWRSDEFRTDEIEV